MDFFVGGGMVIVFVVLGRMGRGGVKIILPETEEEDLDDEDEENEKNRD